jgi:hypothetical protein
MRDETKDLPYKIIVKCRECGKSFKCGNKNCTFWVKKQINKTCICNTKKCYGNGNHRCSETIEFLGKPVKRDNVHFIGERVLQ